jgi:hypothetical protein
VDSDQDEILRQTLEAERQKLTPDQRQRHNHFCEGLRRNEIYTPEDAIKAAKIIRTEDGIRQGAELRYLSQRADQHAQERTRREQREAERQKELSAQRDDRIKVERDREAEQARQQQLEKEAREKKEREAKEQAARDAAKREPVPQSAQRFDAKIKQAEAKTHARNIDRAAGLARTRPDYARHDELKKPQQRDDRPATPQSEFERDNATAEKRSEREASKEKQEARDERIARALKDYARDPAQQRGQGLALGGGGRSR